MFKKIATYWNKFLDKFTVKKRGKRYLRLVVTMNQLKVMIVLLIIACVSVLVKLSSFDMILECDRGANICTISRTSSVNSTPVPLRRFYISRILEISVEARKIQDDKVIYDILLDNGPYFEKVYIDFAYNTVIKTNTVKLKLEKFLASPHQQKFSVTKHCYFDEYFCF